MLSARSRVRRAIPLLTVFALAGCATTAEREYDKYNDKAGSHPLLDRDAFEPIDLACVLDDDECKTAPADAAANGRRIDLTLKKFYTQNQGDLERQRNRVQERLLAASNQRCNDYQALLHRKQANVGFWTGLSSTAFGVAGALVGDLRDSQVLSGLAGIANGWRAEWNQAYFQNATASVIVAGIDSRRASTYEQMVSRGQRRPYSEYPVEAAIKDALLYHGQCSLIVGLQEAGDALRAYPEPGLDAAMKTLLRVNLIRQLNDGKQDIPALVKNWKEALPLQRHLAGNPLPPDGPGEAVSAVDLRPYFQLLAKVQSETGLAVAQLEKIPVRDLNDERKKAFRDTLLAHSDALQKSVETHCKPALDQRNNELATAVGKLAVETDSARQLSLLTSQQGILAQVNLIRSALAYLAVAYAQQVQQVLDEAAKGNNPQAGTGKAMLDSLAVLGKALKDDCTLTTVDGGKS